MGTFKGDSHVAEVFIYFIEGFYQFSCDTFLLNGLVNGYILWKP